VNFFVLHMLTIPSWIETQQQKKGGGGEEVSSAHVLVGVKDLMVYMEDTRMHLKLTFPNMLLRQKINYIRTMQF
jgi:hypothetical protein